MKKLSMAIVGFSALALSMLTSCAELLSPTGKVVDARTGGGVPNVSVTFTPVSGSADKSAVTITAVTAADGTYVANGMYDGTYTVSASLAGYVFVPVEVDVTGYSTTVDTVYGVVTSKNSDPEAITVFLTWDSANDVDAHLTYPSTYESGSTAAKSWADNVSGAYYDLAGDGARTHVFYNNKQNGDPLAFASIDVDATLSSGGKGPETITIVASNQNGTITGSSVASSSVYGGNVLGAGNWYYLGASEYYLNAYTTGNLDADKVKVAVTQGDSIVGIFKPFSGMSQGTISVFRALLFVQGSSWGMVFVPDYRLTDSLGTGTTVNGRSASSSGLPAGAFVVKGGK